MKLILVPLRSMLLGKVSCKQTTTVTDTHWSLPRKLSDGCTHKIHTNIGLTVEGVLVLQQSLVLVLVQISRQEFRFPANDTEFSCGGAVCGWESRHLRLLYKLPNKQNTTQAGGPPCLISPQVGGIQFLRDVPQAQCSHHRSPCTPPAGDALPLTLRCTPL